MSPKFYFVTADIPADILKLLKGKDRMSFFQEAAYSKNAHLWGRQEWFWIVQTFLQTKRAGLDVELVDQPVANSICITHFVATKNKVWPSNCFIVGIRSDTSPLHTKDFEIVQSPALLSKKRSRFICLWPQSDVSPRKTARENKIETISYFGGSGGLSPVFQNKQFRSSLQALGISLNLQFDTKQWGNYSQTDLILAVRNHHHPLLINTKPASKLINAWQAGCVALLGNEPAYRAVGTPGKDYFEVETPQDVLNIIYKLKDNPKLYQQVRKAGMSKYLEYDFDAIAQQWIALLTGPITDAFIEWQNANQSSKLLRHPQRYYQSARQWLNHKLFYIPVRSQILINNFIYR